MKSISQSQSYTSASTGSLKGAIITLTIITAIVHLYISLSNGLFTGTGLGATSLPLLWLLNGLGYLALLVALYLPALAFIRSIVRWILAGYAALTVIVWVVVTQAAFDQLDYLTKLIEIALVVVLIVDAFLPKASRNA